MLFGLLLRLLLLLLFPVVARPLQGATDDADGGLSYVGQAGVKARHCDIFVEIWTEVNIGEEQQIQFFQFFQIVLGDRLQGGIQFVVYFQVRH